MLKNSKKGAIEIVWHEISEQFASSQRNEMTKRARDGGLCDLHFTLNKLSFGHNKSFNRHFLNGALNLQETLQVISLEFPKLGNPSFQTQSI